MFNIIIYWTASSRLPEFEGFRGKTFPGQPQPRPPILEPKRSRLPLSFASEWKNIGSKRSKFDDLGLPVPPKRINVLPLCTQ